MERRERVAVASDTFSSSSGSRAAAKQAGGGKLERPARTSRRSVRWARRLPYHASACLSRPTAPFAPSTAWNVARNLCARSNFEGHRGGGTGASGCVLVSRTMRGAFLAALACALCLANRQPPSGPSRPAGHGDMILRSETCIPTRRVPTILRLRGGSVAAEEQLDRASTSAHEPATPLTVEHCDTSMDPAAGEEGKEGMEGQVRLRMAALKDVIEMQHINLVSLPENYQVHQPAGHQRAPPSLA